MVAQFPRLIDYLCAEEDLKQVTGRLPAHARARVCDMGCARLWRMCARV
jgi:hypothetical protein